MNTGEYKRHKGLTKENLRDNMTNVELALNTLKCPLLLHESKKICPYNTLIINN